MKALLLQFPGPARMRQLGRLARIHAEWHVAEPRWPDFQHQIEAVRPDVIVLDLSKQPTHGIDAALWMHQSPDCARIPVYVVNATPAAERKLHDRVPGIPVVSFEGLCDRLGLNR